MKIINTLFILSVLLVSILAACTPSPPEEDSGILKKFSSEEIECLPLLARASALRYLLTRLIDFHTKEDSKLIIKKDPDEYLKKLKFHQSVKRTSEYGL